MTATECRTFLLYCIPILHGILPDKYVAHCFLLSKAIRLLLSDMISPEDIELADTLLRLFWRLTEHYYGKYHSQIHMQIGYIYIYIYIYIMLVGACIVQIY